MFFSNHLCDWLIPVDIFQYFHLYKENTNCRYRAVRAWKFGLFWNSNASLKYLLNLASYCGIKSKLYLPCWSSILGDCSLWVFHWGTFYWIPWSVPYSNAFQSQKRRRGAFTCISEAPISTSPSFGYFSKFYFQLLTFGRSKFNMWCSKISQMKDFSFDFPCC